MKYYRDYIWGQFPYSLLTPSEARVSGRIPAPAQTYEGSLAGHDITQTRD